MPGQNINRSLHTVTDVMPAGWAGPLVPTDYLTVDLCRRALAVTTPDLLASVQSPYIPLFF